MSGTIEISIGDWCLRSCGGLPESYAQIAANAALVDEFDLEQSGDEVSFLAVGGMANQWPTLVVAQRFEPVGGLCPGALIVPETATLFIGAGTRLLAYDLSQPARKWEDYADLCFWSWRRHGDVVFMSAELELAGYDLHGNRLWSHPVEPPSSFTVEGGTVTLDVMGEITRFDAVTGPQ